MCLSQPSLEQLHQFKAVPSEKPSFCHHIRQPWHHHECHHDKPKQHHQQSHHASHYINWPHHSHWSHHDSSIMREAIVSAIASVLLLPQPTSLSELSQLTAVTTSCVPTSNAPEQLQWPSKELLPEPLKVLSKGLPAEPKW